MNASEMADVFSAAYPGANTVVNKSVANISVTIFFFIKRTSLVFEIIIRFGRL